MIETVQKYTDSIKQLPFSGKAFLVIVVLPTIIAAIYYGLIASDIYISEAKFAIRTNAEAPAAGVIDSLLGGTTASPSGPDLYIVRDYILSRDMLNALDKELDLRGHFQSTEIDRFSRLDKDASQEEFYKYYLSKVGIGMDTNGAIGTLRVRSFAPQFAQKVAANIIEKSETLINNLTNRIVDDSLQFARNEVNMAERKVRDASDAMSSFRTKSQSINPEQETTGVLRIVTELEGELAKSRAELIQAESYMKPESVQVNNLRTKVIALQKQIANEKQRLANDDENKADMNKLIYNYEPLELNKRLAEKEYTSALTSLELARAEAQRKQRYLITFVSPEIPDEASAPDRFTQTLTVFFGSLLTYALGGLIWAAIKDHMRN